MRRCTREDIKSMCNEQPTLIKILRYMIGTEDRLTAKDIAEGANLLVEEVEKTLAFVERTCQEGNFENPIGV